MPINRHLDFYYSDQKTSTKVILLFKRDFTKSVFLFDFNLLVNKVFDRVVVANHTHEIKLRFQVGKKNRHRSKIVWIESRKTFVEDEKIIPW